ncbi:MULTISPECIES: hypothetical protein [unclassified Aminobacter]|uniref:hypothetical protein n=1 Tax=unclassified Aminobacter TaxID=2644704 RepID=UPI0004667C86|nr:MULTISPECIES: hypothetical protein [unclassified Aminobacter]TWH35566.1 hypothetical protein L611_001200000470 [Aminobacter sp. J15]
MKITAAHERIRNNAGYIEASVHYSKRKFDKKYEVVARLKDTTMNELELNIGGEVVLDVQNNRQDALASVRFFRRQD